MEQMAGTRNYQSIGEVLVSVKTEFPDITISKIRFLEAEGLIEPERTPSGYRKFYVDDVERLKSILRMQRDEYLPLKVIKERLLKQDVDEAAADEELELDEDAAAEAKRREGGEGGEGGDRDGGDRGGADGPADVDRGDVGGDRCRARPHPRARVVRHRVLARTRRGQVLRR